MSVQPVLQRVIRLRPAGTVLVVLLALAGCSGNADQRKEEVAEKGDEICADAGDRLNDLQEPEGPGEFASYAAQAEDITDDAVEKLRALDPPAEDREQFNEFVSNFQRQYGLLSQIGVAFERADEREVKQLFDRGDRLGTRAMEAASDYGLDACSDLVEPGKAYSAEGGGGASAEDAPPAPKDRRVESQRHKDDSPEEASPEPDLPPEPEPEPAPETEPEPGLEH